MSEELISDEDRISQNLDLRDRIIKDLTADGIPSSEESLDILLRVLNDSDRTLLTKAKLKSEGNNQKLKRHQADLIAGLLAKVSEKRLGIEPDHSITPPTLTEDDDIELVEGQTDIGVVVLKTENDDV